MASHYDGVRDPNNPVTERLRRLQRAFEGEDRGATTRMAARVGVPWSRWHNVISGYPLSRQLLDQLIKNPEFAGLSADWLLYDRPGNLSANMMEKLQLTTAKDKRAADGSR